MNWLCSLAWFGFREVEIHLRAEIENCSEQIVDHSMIQAIFLLQFYYVVSAFE